MEMAWISAEQVFIMFLLMAVGFFLEKKGIIDKTGTGQMNRFLVLIVVNCMLLDSYIRPYNSTEFNNLLTGMLLAAISILLALASSFALIRGRDDLSRLDRLSITLSNAGFMGIPLITAVLGKESVIYASSYIMVFTVAQWGAGPLILKGRSSPGKALKNIFVNPGVITVLVGMLIFRFSIPIPRPVHTVISYIGSMNTPLAMVLVGAAIARSKFSELIKNYRIYRVCAISLILTPLLMIPVYLLLRPDTNVMLANFLAAACPVAAASAIFPTLYGFDEKYPSQLITVSTLFSIVTIPLMVLVLSAVMGL